MKWKMGSAVAGMLVLLLFCGGCQAMKRMLNNEPRKRAPRPRQVQKQGRQEVFPGSSKSHGKRPSLMASGLSEEEREMMQGITRENRLPERDLRSRSREDKAASDWVFGR
ncbi:MAG: hypothetical protein IKD46_05050 [Lentisphaeria bacterium]|nr:hypothetical protein [Lentisphaeria bacterium]